MDSLTPSRGAFHPEDVHTMRTLSVIYIDFTSYVIEAALEYPHILNDLLFRVKRIRVNPVIQYREVGVVISVIKSCITAVLIPVRNSDMTVILRGDNRL